MKKILMLFAAYAISCCAFAQNSFTVIVQDAETGSLLPGATIAIINLDRKLTTDSNGRADFSPVPDGAYSLRISYIGYNTSSDTIVLPAVPSGPFIFMLEPAGNELLEVVVSSTRSSRTISAIPTRIEVIAGEELDEKANMKPGDIRMVLNESTGIQTQQTSATSANASIRIQGLDGRYTQILKDGFPVYSGAASGLGLLQIPPLDLKQVEVIKGSASTLYGGGAIAGLVNLISKTPRQDGELAFHLNGTSGGGLDLSGFYGERFGKAGITLFASRNSNAPYDPSETDLTAIPKFERYTVNPKLFLALNDRTSLSVGLNSNFEKRIGGDLHYIEGDDDPLHSYFERNKTSRLSTQAALSHKLGKRSELNFRNSLSYFNREIAVPGYLFDGTQHASYSELNYSHYTGKAEWVAGLNLWTDDFRENRITGAPLRDYEQTTAGIFIQNNIHVSNWLELETGLRGDYIVDYGFVLLPRVSALFKAGNQLTSRLGGGMGYKAPTLFTEESERIQYQNVLPVSPHHNELEKSYGGNWDMNYRTSLFDDQVFFSINHLLFYTFLDKPLMLMPVPGGMHRFENLNGHIDSKGMETNIKLSYHDLKLFLGYSLTDTRIHSGGTRVPNPLTAKHRLNNVLMYELEERWKFGAEAYYFSRQKLNDGLQGKPYWIFGFMAEKLWEKFSLYINFENFTDTRQSRFDTIYTGSISNPVFRDIYAPLDGFIINGGLKFRIK